MKNRISKILTSVALVFSLAILSAPVEAQCPMCKMAAESDMANGGSAGKGLNAGILYMLATPYLLVGTVAYLWWRNNKKAEASSEEHA